MRGSDKVRPSSVSISLSIREMRIQFLYPLSRGSFLIDPFYLPLFKSGCFPLYPPLRIMERSFSEVSQAAIENSPGAAALAAPFTFPPSTTPPFLFRPFPYSNSTIPLDRDLCLSFSCDPCLNLFFVYPLALLDMVLRSSSPLALYFHHRSHHAAPPDAFRIVVFPSGPSLISDIGSWLKCWPLSH